MDLLATGHAIIGIRYIFFKPMMTRNCIKSERFLLRVKIKGEPDVSLRTAGEAYFLLGLDSDTFYIYHVAAVMVDNLRRLLLGINLSDKAIMDFDFPGVGFPV